MLHHKKKQVKEDIKTRFKHYDVKNHYIIVCKKILHDALAPAVVVESDDDRVPVGSHVICAHKIVLGRDNRHAKGLYAIKYEDIIMFKSKASKPQTTGANK